MFNLNFRVADIPPCDQRLNLIEILANYTVAPIPEQGIYHENLPKTNHEKSK